MSHFFAFLAFICVYVQNYDFKFNFGYIFPKVFIKTFIKRPKKCNVFDAVGKSFASRLLI